MEHSGGTLAEALQPPMEEDAVGLRSAAPEDVAVKEEDDMSENSSAASATLSAEAPQPPMEEDAVGLRSAAPAEVAVKEEENMSLTVGSASSEVKDRLADAEAAWVVTTDTDGS